MKPLEIGIVVQEFQFLIGTVKITHERLDIGIKSLFQFLIGTVKINCKFFNLYE